MGKKWRERLDEEFDEVYKISADIDDTVISDVKQFLQKEINLALDSQSEAIIKKIEGFRTDDLTGGFENFLDRILKEVSDTAKLKIEGDKIV